MLTGTQEPSSKRAVFLVERACLGGKPDYALYCRSIDSKVYMHPFSVRKTIACQLGEPASGYAQKFPNGNSDFMLRCTDKALEYYPADLRVLL